MSSFPSHAWCVQAVALLNADPDFPSASVGWEGDFGVVIDLDDGTSMGLSVGHPQQGALPAPQFLPAEEVEARAPRYFARATQADWWALISGGLDPIAAIVQKRLTARGDLTQVVARLQYRGLAERWLSNIRRGG